VPSISSSSGIRPPTTPSASGSNNAADTDASPRTSEILRRTADLVALRRCETAKT
jgi:hypothetical protein